MSERGKSYKVANGEAFEGWYVIEIEKTGATVRRTILADSYLTEEDATNAAAVLEIQQKR